MKARIETQPDGKKTVHNVCTEPCAIERGMRIIGGKWKGSILWHLKDGPVRFNDLVRMLGGASKKIVDQRLKEMEAQVLFKSVQEFFPLRLLESCSVNLSLLQDLTMSVTGRLMALNPWRTIAFCQELGMANSKTSTRSLSDKRWSASH